VLEWVARVDDERCRPDRFGDDPRSPRAHREQDIDRRLNKLSSKCRHAIVAAIREALLEGDVLAFDVAELREPGSEQIEVGASRARSADFEPADARYAGALLRIERRRRSKHDHAKG
jgi:hypothetical protein